MSDSRINSLRAAGAINRLAIKQCFDLLRGGVSLEYADKKVGRYIQSHGGNPAFKGYRGFPANVCISLNDEIVHGIPDDRKTSCGDVVTVDLGTEFNGWIVDSARTEIIGSPRSSEDANIVKYAYEVLLGGLRSVTAGASLSVVASAMDGIAGKYHLTIIPSLGGHRVGRTVHENPFIPMTMWTKGLDYDYSYVFKPGDVMCLEPIVVDSDRSTAISIMPDGWTVKHNYGAISAHFEHTILVTNEGHEVLA